MPLGWLSCCAPCFSAPPRSAAGPSALKAAAFKAERLSPLKGIKRIFGANGLNELVKAMAKFPLVAVIAVSWLWYSADDLLALGRQPIDEAIS